MNALHILLLATSALALAAPATSHAQQPHGDNAASADDAGGADLAAYPSLFAADLAQAKQFVGEMMEAGAVVPVPADPGGGYTHEQHKRNYRAIYLAGRLYRITGEQAYADYARDVLLAYAQLYPTLSGPHPAASNQNTGRLFWQVLNDAVWQVYAVQGYGDIRDGLTAGERARIDDDVFRRAAEFLSVESSATFNLIHNHATWATAGVGMTGYLLGDQDMVDRALLGSDKSGTSGFLRQTELLFSPDGYYTEGPYYQRYALMPFMVFADSIERNDPARAIFEHRGGILLKALRTTVQLTYDEHFFPFNDAMKDKSLQTEELYNGIAIAYGQTRDPALLSIARDQGHTVLSDNGLLVASDLAAGLAQPFPFRSMLLRDGPEGDQGAVAILRDGTGPDHTALVAKNASQGMGHGHFDKLSWQFYDNGNEIVTDYGAARFLNIEAKQGGRYLPENESWAKQTIAHNTLAVNGQSHFYGDRDLADLAAPTQLYFNVGDDLQVSAASIDDAYPREGVRMLRLQALMTIEGLEHPVAIDLLRANGDGDLQFDLPLHYAGHIMRLGFDLDRNIAARPVLGADHGYQHIWEDGRGAPVGDQAFMTWLLDGRFYTYRFVPGAGQTVILGQIGANDPSFNLRREPLVIQRAAGSDSATFVSILEPHGLYDGAAEQTIDSDSQIASLKHYRTGTNDIAVIETLSGTKVALAISWDDNPATTHSAAAGGHDIEWQGYAARILLDNGEDR